MQDMNGKNTFSIPQLFAASDKRLAHLGRAVLALQKINPQPAFLTKDRIQMLLQALADIIHSELGYPNCEIFLVDEKGQALEFKAGTGFLISNPLLHKSILDWQPKLDEEAHQGRRGLIGWVGSHRQVTNIGDVHKDPRYYPFEHKIIGGSELTVPLLYNSTELIGVLDIQSANLDAFDELDVEIVSFFASMAASLIHSVYLARTTANHLENLTLLAHTANSINNSLTLPEIGRLALENVVQALGAFSGAIWTYDPREGLNYRLTALNLAEVFTNRPLYVGPQLLQCLENHELVLISQLSEYNTPTEVIERLDKAGVGAFGCLPLYVRDETLGVMFVNYSEPHQFTSTEKHLMTIFADRVAAALLNARSSGREQAARRVADSLVRSSRLISSRLEPDEVLQTIVDEVIMILGVPMCSFSLLDEEQTQIVRMIVRGAVSSDSVKVKLKLGEGFIGTVAVTGKLWKEYDMALLPEFTNNPVRIRENWRAGIAVPIKLREAQGSRVLGVLCVHDHIPRDFTVEEVAYLEGLADQAAVTITNAKNFAALKRERDMYQALLENANDPIFLLNPVTGQIQDANHRATETTGYSYEELLGQPVNRLYPIEERSQLDQLRNLQTSEEKQTATIVENIMMQRKDGTCFPISYSARLVQVGEEQVIIQIVRDMSERRAMEQQLVRSEQLRALGQLASGVAHDFNNLLTGILGVSELLLNGLPADEERRLLKMMRQSALDGAHMVRRVQMLGPSHESNGFSPVDLNSLVNDVVELTRPRWRGTAQQRGITIGVEIETELVPPVNGNASELREVITNLVLNAVDAMPLGGQLTLCTELHDDKVWLVVSDSGMGMSEETQRRLFEPFFTTKAKEGHGLGLSVSNSIIARHKGTIEIESTLGQGSRFIIKLPLAETIAPEKKAASKAALSKALAVPPCRILIVDDDPNLLYILRRILQTDQHIVTTTTSGQEAIQLVTDNPDGFDLVFSDLSIADVSGWNVTRAIKKLRPNLPVALVTGWGVDLEPEMLRLHGISEVISKPYRLEEVQATIKRLIAD